VAYTHNSQVETIQGVAQLSLSISTGVVFNKLIYFFGKDQYQCLMRSPIEWGASSGNSLSSTPIHPITDVLSTETLGEKRI